MPNLLKILLRKTKTLLINGFWNVLRYRPKGYYADVAAYIKDFADAHQHIVYESFVSDNSQYAHVYNIGRWASDRAAPIHSVEAAYVLHVPQGSVYTDWGANMGVIAPNKKLIGEVSFQHINNIYEGVHQNALYKKKFIDSPQYYDKNVCSIIVGGGSNHNYFHWFFDSIVRIDLLKKAQLFDQIDYWYVPNYDLAFQKETFELLGIPPEKIISSQTIRYIKAKNLYCTFLSRPSGHISVWMCDFLKTISVPTYENLRWERIFILRKNTFKRKILNENELKDFLPQFGFQPIFLEDLRLSEQIFLFSQVKFVVAQHGAGLTNIVFCQKNTKILDIYDTNGTVGPEFAGLSVACQLDYHTLEIPRAYPSDERELDMLIPLTMLENILQKLCADTD